MPTRIAHATWTGSIQSGKGMFNGDSGLSGTYSFASRFQDGKGSTPEELLAAAQAACFSMALELGLEQNGTPATSIHTNAACSIVKDGAGFTINMIQLRVRAVVPNLDEAKFVEIASHTKDTCPVSKLFAGNAEITIDAALSADAPPQNAPMMLAGGGIFPHVRV